MNEYDNKNKEMVGNGRKIHRFEKNSRVGKERSENSMERGITYKIWRVALGEKTRQTYQKRLAEKLKEVCKRANIQVPYVYLSRTDLRIIEAIISSRVGEAITYTKIRWRTGFSFPTIKERVEYMEKWGLVKVIREKRKKRKSNAYQVEIEEKGLHYYSIWKQIYEYVCV